MTGTTPQSDAGGAGQQPSLSPSQYMSERLEPQIRYYERGANAAKRKHFAIQTTVVGLGVFLPVVVNLSAQIEARQVQLAALATAVSLVLAFLNGIANLRKHGDLWLQFRITEELLKREKFLYLTRSEPYEESDRDVRFVASVEALISSEHNRFHSLMEEARRPARPQDPSRQPPVQPLHS